MSRIGKIPVKLPKEVKVAIDTRNVQLDGPKGKLSLALPAGVKVEQKDDILVVSRLSDVKQYRSNHGTTRAILKNMIQGVTKGHKKELEIQGVGFRGQMKGDTMVLNLGLSHQVEFKIPKEVKVAMPKLTEIVLEGSDKALVGEVAAKIRDLKPPEPYKGKGIRYVGEKIIRKQGKSVTK
jgi:large subunit ribosomal protein L6